MVITRGQITKGSVDSVSHGPTRMVHRTQAEKHTRTMRSLENEEEVHPRDDNNESNKPSPNDNPPVDMSNVTQTSSKSSVEKNSEGKGKCVRELWYRNYVCKLCIQNIVRLTSF